MGQEASNAKKDAAYHTFKRCRLALNYENAIQAIPDASAGT